MLLYFTNLFNEHMHTTVFDIQMWQRQKSNVYLGFSHFLTLTQKDFYIKSNP